MHPKNQGFFREPALSPSLIKGGGRIVEKRGFAPLKHPIIFNRRRDSNQGKGARIAGE